MKTVWKTQLLGEVFKTSAGGTPLKSKKEYYENGNIPWLLSGEVGQGEVSTATNFISQQGLDNSSAKLFPPNTVLVAMYGATAGQVGILRFKAATNQAVCGILPNDCHLPEFLYYFLLSQKNGLVAQAVGNAQPNISQEKIRGIKFPIISLAEQQRIVAILDEAFEGIATAVANAEKNLSNSRELLLGELHSAFSSNSIGWEKKCISEIAKHSLGKMLDKNKNQGEPQPYLRNQNVRWFKFDLSDLLEMKFLPSESEKYTAIRGDLMICEGGYPGRAAIWDEDNPIYFQKAIHRVRFHNLDHGKWVLHYLHYLDSYDKLKQHFTGSGIQHFTGEALAKFIVPVPTDDDLKLHITKFKKLSEQVELLEATYQQKLDALAELKQSILHQAFTGQLN